MVDSICVTGEDKAIVKSQDALEILSQRLPNLHLFPPDQRPPYTPDLQFRGIQKLFVRWGQER